MSTPTDFGSFMVQTDRDQAPFRDLASFALFEQVPDNPKARAVLRFGVWNGNPRINYSPNQEGAAKMIGFGIEPPAFHYFLDQLAKVAVGPNDTTMRFGGYAGEGEGRERSPSKTPQTTIVYGKDADGVVWLGVADKRVSKNLRFKLLLSNWHFSAGKDGTPLPPASFASDYALAYIEGLKRAYTFHLGMVSKPFEKTRRNATSEGGEANFDFNEKSSAAKDPAKSVSSKPVNDEQKALVAEFSDDIPY